ncbi:MAG TPA: hypothetical protein VF525_12860 [Pyrinomonadaceae bacterium]|jgi:hypothetical protein
MKQIQQFACVCILLLGLPGLCAAQTRPRTATVPPQPSPQLPTSPAANAQPQTNVQEDFDLNIEQRRITEQDFFASTSVSAGDEQARGLRLLVGVAVGAQQIDVLLRNVRGHVRFHASLDPLLRVIDARRTSPPPLVGNPVP